MSSVKSVKSFWDQAADQNPYWFVSSYGPYDVNRNLDEFWASGCTIWTDIKEVTSYTPRPDDTVVEIGCGVGRLTRAIAPDVGRVIALDISERMLAIARQANLPNVDFREVDGFTLPGISDGSVDLALGYCVFQHLPSHPALKSYLAEMHRVVRPGGMIAFTMVPRDWKAWLLPVLRVRAFLWERFSRGRPKGIYRKEWVGIRPSAAAVYGMSPTRLDRYTLGVGRILYFGRRWSA